MSYLLGWRNWRSLSNFVSTFYNTGFPTSDLHHLSVYLHHLMPIYRIIPILRTCRLMALVSECASLVRVTA